MADENTIEPTTNTSEVEASQAAESAPETLGENGTKALQAEREARRAAEKARKDLEAQLAEVSGKLQKHEEANSTEIEKALKRAERAEKLATEFQTASESANLKLTRYEVAQEKGVTGEALNLLNGSSREELEAQADSILSIMKAHKESVTAPVVSQEGKTPATLSGPEADFANAMKAFL